MRFVGNRRKQWSGYVILALTIGLAWLTRNRPRYRSRFPYETNTPRPGRSGSATGSARVYDSSRARAAATATAATAGAARVYDRAEDPSPYLTRRLDPAEVDPYRNRRRALWWLVPLLLIPFLVCILAWLVARNGGIDNTPSSPPAAVQVDPQRATGGNVTLDRVVAPQNSWVALYRTNANGQPDLNAPLGTVPIGAGESTDVNVPLDQPVASGEQVAAVLHADNGATGTFEPNGADTPLPLNNGSTATTFAIGAAGALAAAAQASSSPPQPQPPVGSGSAQASASGTQAGGVGANAAATPSTASGASSSSAALAGAAALGTSTDQAAAADATTTGTVDPLGAAAGAAGAATAESDPTATTDAVATTATGALSATPDTSATLAAAGAATNDTATAEALDATPDATANAETSTAAASATTTAEIDAASDATSASTSDATDDGVVTTAASDTAIASNTATGSTTPPESATAALDVDPNEASIVAAQQPEGVDTVTLDRVVVPTNGWVAVYRRNADGTPNYDDLLGSAPVQQGENTDVNVPLTEALGTDDAVVVLHTDAGTIGTFDDSNNVDLPVTANGAMVTATIAASDDAATGTAQPTAASDQTGAASDQTAAPSASKPVVDQTTETPATASNAAASAASNDSAAPNVTAETTETATPTETAQQTATATPTETAAPAATATPTETAAPTNTVEPTQTPTASATPTATPAPTTTATAAPTMLPTEAPATANTATPTGAATATPAPTAASAATPTATGNAAPGAASGTTGGATASASPSPNVGAGASASPSPQGVVVNNTAVSGSTTVLDQVTIVQNGWAVLYRADANGQPSPNAIVGVAPVQAGVSTNVQVPLNGMFADGDKIVVVLHVDAGTSGMFEYPNGPDTPLAIERAAPVLTVQAPEQLPETGVAARAWTALAAALVLCTAGLALRRYPAR